ncbi:MAG: hypothetical protein ACU83N_00200 [Gammaproteobacteria bacterium]
MKKIQDCIVEVGRLWGLPIHKNKQTVFGAKEGLAVQLFTGEGGALVGIVRWDNPERDSMVQDHLMKSSALRLEQVNLEHIQVANGMAVYTIKRHIFGLGMLSTDKIVRQMQALVGEIKAVVGQVSQVCRFCGAGAAFEPVLVNGIVDRFCDDCLAKIQLQAKEQSCAYEALSIHWVRALTVGTILMFTGAILWTAVTMYTETMYWALAIGIGVVIGWATTKSAGKGDIGVQLACGIFTLLSVVGGTMILLALAALGTSIENDVLNTSLFVQNFLRFLMESVGDIAFAISGAVLGAVISAQRAGKPKFDVSVDR